MRTPARFALAIASLLLATSVHAAAGINIRWGICMGDGGTANKNFACDTNSGTETLVGSFELGPAGVAQVSGNEIVIDLASAGAVLPEWWNLFNVGLCRQRSLGITTAFDPASQVCLDWADGQSTPGIGAYKIGIRGPNTARIVAVLAVPGDLLMNLVGGVEYFSFNVLFTHTKTVGTDACGGCLTPVCLVFSSLNITTPVPANNIKLMSASNSTDSNVATWQGGAGVNVGGSLGCPAATPTRNSTWGSVKAMYR